MEKRKWTRKEILWYIGTGIFLFLMFMLYPALRYVNSHYAEPRECTVESARFSRGGTGTKVASSKNAIAVETTECGLIITPKVVGGTDDLLKNIDLVNQYQGQKLVFMIGPLSWNPGNTRAEYVIIPEQ